MKKVLLVISAMLLATSVAAQNTPCSRGKGGISHCNGSTFICNDRSESQSTKDCSVYLGSQEPTPTPIHIDASVKHKRSSNVVRAFKKTHICPSTNKNTQKCPGYIVDHIIALACGGADSVANMQYQTIKDAKAKDKIELACTTPGQ